MTICLRSNRRQQTPRTKQPIYRLLVEGKQRTHRELPIIPEESTKQKPKLKAPPSAILPVDTTSESEDDQQDTEHKDTTNVHDLVTPQKMDERKPAALEKVSEPTEGTLNEVQAQRVSALIQQVAPLGATAVLKPVPTPGTRQQSFVTSVQGLMEKKNQGNNC